MSSLCYLFLHSFLIPTIDRKLGPWEVKLQKWHLGWKPMWGVSSLTVQGRSTDLFVYWLWFCSEQTKCQILLTSRTHLFCDQHRFQRGVGDESPPQQCRGAVLCDYALQIQTELPQSWINPQKENRLIKGIQTSASQTPPQSFHKREHMRPHVSSLQVHHHQTEDDNIYITVW